MSTSCSSEPLPAQNAKNCSSDVAAASSPNFNLPENYARCKADSSGSAYGVALGHRRPVSPTGARLGARATEWP